MIAKFPSRPRVRVVRLRQTFQTKVGNPPRRQGRIKDRMQDGRKREQQEEKADDMISSRIIYILKAHLHPTPQAPNPHTSAPEDKKEIKRKEIKVRTKGS